MQGQEKVANKVPGKILSSLITSLLAGVVPRVGAPYVAIGRDAEVCALLDDLKSASEGGSKMRFVIGRYGSGKSFLMQLMRGYALERGYVTVDCDLSPERKLCGGKGSGIATYRELTRNMATKTSPTGGAIGTVISKWLSSIRSEIAAGGLDPDTPEFENEVSKRVYGIASELDNNVGGFDFSRVIKTYYTASVLGNDDKKAQCIRWLCGEYTTKTECRADLGVGTIIDDENWYDYLKLLCAFVRLIGYPGLIVFIDECVNLYKITNRIGRENNYEKILSMFNDTLQGRAPGLCIVMGGTPEFLEDRRRGLFSYEALRSRLSDSTFVTEGGYTDMTGPVIRLKKLSNNEMLALIGRVKKLHEQYHNWTAPVTAEDEITFLNAVTSRVGANSLITPREVIRDWLSALNILMQNEKVSFEELIESVVDSGACKNAKDEDDGAFTIDDIEI